MVNLSSLKQNRVIANIIKLNQKIHSSDLSLYYQKNSEGQIRYAISVSKKHFKLAVNRNRIKRQIRAMFIKLKHDIPVDIVIIIKPNYKCFEFEKKCLRLNTLLNKISKNLKTKEA
ncbi:ribonuclease P protein component [Ureaplasma canigenitalium]|uniref:ribonuclease P protein component n=1 Tax=Ureaplasma canigenitalium TaxID=42092 RepID=UPI00068BB86D|nr:ribonuclease P protein component [Ureaplasma canigenitalium]